MKTKAMRAWVVLDADEVPLCFGDGPWEEGKECLYDGMPEKYTVFTKKEEAQKALRLSKSYCKKEDLEFYWETKKWKIIQIESPYGVE